MTDRTATRRLRESIEAREETVELLLNYKKTSEPFWNLLLVGWYFSLKFWTVLAKFPFSTLN